MDVFSVSFQETDTPHASINNVSNKVDRKEPHERSPNGREKDSELRTSRSKLPRIVKTQATTHASKCFKPSDKKQNDSGDNKPGPSRPPGSPSSRENSCCEGDKIKRSQIPRRRNYRDAVSEDVAGTKKSNTKPPFKTQAKNVRRLQVLNTLQDYYTEKRPTSVAATRPIPTLGQIYQNAADSSRVTNWLIETDNNFLHTPANSLAPDGNQRDSTDSAEISGSVVDIDVVSKTRSEKPIPPVEELSQDIFKSTTNNLNGWLGDVEYPTRDIESGYRSMSPSPNKPKKNNAKQLNRLPIVKQSEKNHYLAIPNKECSEESIVSNEVKKDNSTDTNLMEQPTVLLLEKAQQSDHVVDETLPTLGTSISPTQTSETELTKTFQFPSNPNPNNGTFAISYVDCASEVLQKTTDFETAGYTSSVTLSSIIGTDIEYRDNFSSRATLEQIDDCSMLEYNSRWSNTRVHEKSLYNTSEHPDMSEQITICDSHGKGNSDTSGTLMISTDTFQPYCSCCMKRHTRWQRRHGDGRDFFKKYYKGRLFITMNSKFKDRRTTNVPGKRLSFRRLCRLRWDYVCQKTAERWANRPKSSFKFMKFRMMHPEVFWEDIDVQTITAPLKDTSTGSVMWENKSASIVTSLRWPWPTNLLPAKDAATSRVFPDDKKPIQKHANSGPSMFVLQLNNSKVKVATPQSSENKTKNRKNFQNSAITVLSLHSRSNNLSELDALPEKPVEDDRPYLSTENTDYSRKSSFHDVEYKTVSSCTDVATLLHKDKSTSIDTNYMQKSVSIYVSNIDNERGDRILLDKSTITEACFNIPDNNKSTLFTESEIVFTGEAVYKGCTCALDDAKPNTNLDNNYLKQMSQQAITNIACNTSETNIPFVAMSACKYCQARGSNGPLHQLRSHSTSIRYSKDSKAQIIGTGPQSFGAIVSNLIPKKSVESGKEKTVKPVIGKVSAAIETSADALQPKISVGVSGTIEKSKKEVALETVPPLTHLGFQGPKIVSISSAFATSASITDLKCKSENTGIPSTQKVNKDVYVFTNPLSTREFAQFTDGTEQLSDIRGRSKSTSIERLELYPDAGTSRTSSDIREQSKSTLIQRQSLEYTDPGMTPTNSMEKGKWSFNAVSFEVPQPNKNINRISGGMNTEPESTKTIGLGTSNFCLNHTPKMDVFVQHGKEDVDPIKVQRSAGIACNLKPSPFLTGDVIATQTENDDPVTGQDQDTWTSFKDKLLTLPKIDCNCSAVPDAVLSSDLNAAKWIKRCISNMEKDQIINILGQHTSKSKVSNKSDSKQNCSNKNSKFRLNAPHIDVFPCSEMTSEAQLAAMACVSCLKPQVSSPDLSMSKPCSKELVKQGVSEVPSDKLPTKQSTSISIIVNTAESAQQNDLKETVAQTALEVQDKATDAWQILCGDGQKSESVFTSRFVLPSPKPCRNSSCKPDSVECLFVYNRPHCLVHKSLTDATVQMIPSLHDIVLSTMSRCVPSHRSIALSSACLQPELRCTSQITELVGEVWTPHVYQAIYESNEADDQELKTYCNRSTDTNSNTLLSALQNCHKTSAMAGTDSSHCAPLLEVPSSDGVAKHLSDECEDLLHRAETQVGPMYTEACTVKPSGRNETACQVDVGLPKIIKTVSCCTLYHAYSATDICGNEKDNLKTVYYMLTAIEGRIRRLKQSYL